MPLHLACLGTWHVLACVGMQNMPWHMLACPGTSCHVLMHPSTPWHALALHVTPWHSMALLGTPWYSLALLGMFWHALAASTWHTLVPSVVTPSMPLLACLACLDTHLHSFTH